MYTIVDLKGISLSTTNATIPGTYARIGSTGKAKLIRGINFGGTKKDDTFAELVPSGSGASAKYTTTIYGKVLTVTVADKVSIADPT
jgi:hypothetical protein